MQEKILKKEAVISVIGLGYVGLPLVREFFNNGFSVLGFDIDLEKLNLLKAGQSYISSLPASCVQSWINSSKFQVTNNPLELQQADVLIICVPTPLNKHREPDLTFIKNTVETIGQNLRKGQLVILESTTYPGTTVEFVKPLLEKFSNLKVGIDFYLGYSPEREDPGNKTFTTGTIPKVVGADDPISLELVTLLYSQITPKAVPVSSTKVAEATKLYENIFRVINISLVNELKIVFDKMGIDIWEVIEASKTKPFGFMPFYPGPGACGPCLAKDHFYLTWKAQEYGLSAKFIEVAGEVNHSIIDYIIRKTSEGLNLQKKAIRASKILILGVAYKADVNDIRESAALPIIQQLDNLGAEVLYYDPYIETIRNQRQYPGLVKHSEKELTKKLLNTIDCVIIITNHTNVDYLSIVQETPLIIDTRNVCKNLKGKAVIIKA